MLLRTWRKGDLLADALTPTRCRRERYPERGKMGCEGHKEEPVWRRQWEKAPQSLHDGLPGIGRESLKPAARAPVAGSWSLLQVRVVVLAARCLLLLVESGGVREEGQGGGTTTSNPPLPCRQRACAGGQTASTCQVFNHGVRFVSPPLVSRLTVLALTIFFPGPWRELLLFPVDISLCQHLLGLLLSVLSLLSRAVSLPHFLCYHPSPFCFSCTAAQKIYQRKSPPRGSFRHPRLDSYVCPSCSAVASSPSTATRASPSLPVVVPATLTLLRVVSARLCVFSSLRVFAPSSSCPSTAGSSRHLEGYLLFLRGETIDKCCPTTLQGANVVPCRRLEVPGARWVGCLRR